MSASENDSTIEQAVIRTLTYFDLFDYPLKSSEVYNFLPLSVPKSDVEKTLELLATQKQIARSNELFSLKFNPHVFERRRMGNALADALLPSICKQAHLIFQFPFVRSVMASGSFSKNYMDEKSDFDFFIVCAPNRIWISRMLMVIYKKVFLKNSHKYFCVNYFVDEQNLEIGEKNIFTATELATVLPLTGFSVYKNLMASNRNWLITEFPNYSERTKITAPEIVSAQKRLLEILFNIFLGSYINKLFKWITLRKWKRAYGNRYAPSDFNIAFKSTDGVSKNHPQNFQKIILNRFEARVASLTKKTEAA